MRIKFEYNKLNALKRKTNKKQFLKSIKAMIVQVDF